MTASEATRFRRARGLSLSWIEGEPLRHRVVRPDTGAAFAVGPRALALLEAFGPGEEASVVLAGLIPAEAPPDEQERWFAAMDKLVGNGLIVRSKGADLEGLPPSLTRSRGEALVGAEPLPAPGTR